MNASGSSAIHNFYRTVQAQDTIISQVIMLMKLAADLSVH